ncbi:unnamed protein product, partial [Amoebophrya sp. A25]
SIVLNFCARDRSGQNQMGVHLGGPSSTSSLLSTTMSLFGRRGVSQEESFFAYFCMKKASKPPSIHIPEAGPASPATSSSTPLQGQRHRLSTSTRSSSFIDVNDPAMMTEDPGESGDDSSISDTVPIPGDPTAILKQTMTKMRELWMEEDATAAEENGDVEDGVEEAAQTMGGGKKDQIFPKNAVDAFGKLFSGNVAPLITKTVQTAGAGARQTASAVAREARETLEDVRKNVESGEQGFWDTYDDLSEVGEKSGSLSGMLGSLAKKGV